MGKWGRNLCTSDYPSPKGQHDDSVETCSDRPGVDDFVGSSNFWRDFVVSSIFWRDFVVSSIFRSLVCQFFVHRFVKFSTRLLAETVKSMFGFGLSQCS